MDLEAKRNNSDSRCRHGKEGGSHQAKDEGLDCLVQDVVEMTPQSHNRYFSRAMVPNEALCRIVTTFLVAEYVKGKMTR